MSEPLDHPLPAADTPPAAPPPAPEPSAPRRRRLWLVLPLAVLLQALLLLLLAVLWVLGTQGGLRAALALAEDLAPGVVSVGRVEGRILGDLTVGGLAVATPEMALRLDSLRLRWTPLAALGGTLRVQELTARGISVVTVPSEEEDGPITLPEIVLPVRLVIERAEVTDLSIAETGGEPFRIDRIALAAAWQGKDVTLDELSLALPEPRLAAKADGRAELTGSYPLTLALAWTLALESGAGLAGEASVGGDLERLTLAHELTGAARARLEAVVEDVLDSPRWTGTLGLAGVDLPALGQDLPALDLTARLETSGTLDAARVVGSLAGKAPGQPGFGELSGDLDLTWREDVLELATLALTETASGARLTAGGRIDLGTADGAVDLRAAWEKLRWPLTGEVLAESGAGRLTVAGSLADFRYEVSADVRGPDIPRAGISLSGTGDRTATRIGELQVETLDGRIRGTGTLAWDPAPAWDLEVTAEGLDPGRQWPGLPARVGVGITTSGGPDAYRYSLGGGIEGPGLPDAAVSMSGEGDLAGSRIEALRIDTLNGRIEGAVTVGWEPSVRWDAVLTASAIDPGAQWPEWPGSLDARVASSGSLEEGGPAFTAAIERLAGKLRGYPVEAKGRMAAAGGAFTVEDLLVTSGPSRLTAGGAVGERLDLAFAFDSPGLSTLLPDARGRVKASGRASGPMATPAVEVEVDAKGAGVAQQQVDSLTGRVALDLAPGGRVAVDLTGRGIAAGAVAFSELRLEGDGALGDHRLSARARGEPVAFDLEAAGGLNGSGAYDGRLISLDLRTTDFGDWRLQKPAGISIAGENLEAGPLCLRAKDGSGGCARFASRGAGTWEADADLGRIAFELFASFLPPDLTLAGAATAKARVRFANGTVTGDATVAVPRGVLTAEAGGGAAIDFSAARLTAEANGGGLNARLALPVAGLGSVEGDVGLPGWRVDAPARPDQPLRGRVRARADSLKLVSPLVPDITGLKGRVDADMGLGGTLGVPALTGYARLADLGFRVPILGLDVSNGRFEAEARGRGRVDYSGGLDVGGRRLDLEGASRLAGGAWETRLRASGDRLKVADSKEYLALVSPDVTLQAGPEGMAVTGEIRVPEARIRPRVIPAGAVTPSPDVVMKGQGERGPPLPFAIDLRLALGDQVAIDAFGLRGKLRGDLRVLKDPARDELLGDGSIAVVDGAYRISGGSALVAAVGKPLTVEQGRLVFANTPLDNPGLLLTATREGGDLTAGVRVVGTLRNPKLTFFSESDPGLTQSEITNYLITGIPPKRGGESQADRSLAVGTYVAPKLYMEYESSLGDQSDRVKMRYELNNWIEFQTETGDDQGADVFFKFER